MKKYNKRWDHNTITENADIPRYSNDFRKGGNIRNTVIKNVNT